MNTLTKSIGSLVNGIKSKLGMGPANSIPKAEYEAMMGNKELQKKHFAANEGKTWWVVDSKPVSSKTAKPVAKKDSFSDAEMSAMLALVAFADLEEKRERAAQKTAAAKRAPVAPKKINVQPATPAAPLAGADLTAQRLKDKYPAVAKGNTQPAAPTTGKGLAGAVEAYSAENREANLHPFAKAAERIRKNPYNF